MYKLMPPKEYRDTKTNKNLMMVMHPTINVQIPCGSQENKSATFGSVANKSQEDRERLICS